ncbi:MAG TPA: hypothetical protein VEC37_10060 [Bacillota bacterium]|nr:hypothetical protein [Bacillota bacterium]
MGKDIHIIDNGNDTAEQKAGPWVNIRQENKCKVKVKQDSEQQTKQEEEVFEV